MAKREYRSLFLKLFAEAFSRIVYYSAAAILLLLNVHSECSNLGVSIDTGIGLLIVKYSGDQEFGGLVNVHVHLWNKHTFICLDRMKDLKDCLGI